MMTMRNDRTPSTYQQAQYKVYTWVINYYGERILIKNDSENIIIKVFTKFKLRNSITFSILNQKLFFVSLRSVLCFITKRVMCVI